MATFIVLTHLESDPVLVGPVDPAEAAAIALRLEQADADGDSEAFVLEPIEVP